jgi:hypothetical protein
MRRQDWPAVFVCLDVSDLKKIAANAVALSLGASIDEAERTSDVAHPARSKMSEHATLAGHHSAGWRHTPRCWRVARDRRRETRRCGGNP